MKIAPAAIPAFQWFAGDFRECGPIGHRASCVVRTVQRGLPTQFAAHAPRKDAPPAVFDMNRLRGAPALRHAVRVQLFRQLC